LKHIETMTANPMTSDPCQLKLTIEGSEHSTWAQLALAHAAKYTGNSNAK